jgi:hypothetical protein
MFAGEHRPAVHQEGRLAALAAIGLYPASFQPAESGSGSPPRSTGIGGARDARRQCGRIGRLVSIDLEWRGALAAARPRRGCEADHLRHPLQVGWREI